jgi:predicted N-acyltransferase
VLRAGAIALARQSGLSSAHVNFADEAEDIGFGDDWLQRIDLQYHWHNAAGWEDFNAFLAAMDHKHPTNIRL